MIDSKASHPDLTEKDDKDITLADKYSTEHKLENNQYPTTTETALFIKVPQPFLSTALTPVNNVENVNKAPNTSKLEKNLNIPRNSLPDKTSEISIPSERSPNDFANNKYDKFKLNRLQKNGDTQPKIIKMKDYHYFALSKDIKSLGIHPKENLVVQLSRLKISDEIILPVVFGSNAETVEEAMDYIFKDQLEDWNHKFVNKNDVEIAESVCPTCLQNNQKERIESKVNRIQIFPENEKFVGFVRNGMVIKNSKCQQILNKKKEKITLTTDVSQANLNITHDTTKADPCYVCGDDMESHSPDFNVEKYDESPNLRETPPTKKYFNKRHMFVNIRNLSEQSMSTHDYIATPKVEEEEKAVERCLICYENLYAMPSYKKIITALCGHRFCSSCIDHYMFLQIEKIKPAQFKCPVPTCDQIFPQDFVTSQVTLFQWFLYKIRQKELEFIKDNKLIYCPACWDPVKLPDNDVQPPNKNSVTCRSCSTILCKLCGKIDHGSLNCAENVSKYYSKLARGKDIQLCPNCKAVVKKSEKSSHMFCGNCKTMFCFYCRKQKSKCSNDSHSHNNLENEFRCCPENQSTLSLVTRKKLPNFYMFLISLLVIILSPLIALLIVPYIVMKNVLDNLQRTNPEDSKESKHVLTSGEVSIDQHISKNASAILVSEPTNNNWLKTTTNDKPPVVYYKNSTGNCLMAYLAGFGTFLIFPLSIIGVIIISFVTLFTNIFS